MACVDGHCFNTESDVSYFRDRFREFFEPIKNKPSANVPYEKFSWVYFINYLIAYGTDSVHGDVLNIFQPYFPVNANAAETGLTSIIQPEEIFVENESALVPEGTSMIDPFLFYYACHVIFSTQRNAIPESLQRAISYIARMNEVSTPYMLQYILRRFVDNPRYAKYIPQIVKFIQNDRDTKRAIDWRTVHFENSSEFTLDTIFRDIDIKIDLDFEERITLYELLDILQKPDIPLPKTNLQSAVLRNIHNINQRKVEKLSLDDIEAINYYTTAFSNFVKPTQNLLRYSLLSNKLKNHREELFIIIRESMPHVNCILIYALIRVIRDIDDDLTDLKEKHVQIENISALDLSEISNRYINAFYLSLTTSSRAYGRAENSLVPVPRPNVFYDKKIQYKKPTEYSVVKDKITPNPSSKMIVAEMLFEVIEKESRKLYSF